METTQRFALSAVAIAALLGLAACADMTQQEKNTAIGAGVGAVGGSRSDGRQRGGHGGWCRRRRRHRPRSRQAQEMSEQDSQSAPATASR